MFLEKLSQEVKVRHLKASRPFQEPEFLTREEERRFLFERIAHLPNRTGYLFLKAHAAEAILLNTNTIEIGDDFEDVVHDMKGTPEFGDRVRRPRDAEREVNEDARDVFSRMEEGFQNTDE